MPNRRLLLLIEDNADDEEVTLRGLQKAALRNCKVEVARDGQQALDYLLGEGPYAEQGSVIPDLIVLDLSLPRVPGLEVLKRIRTDSRLALTPVVIMSSSIEQSDRLRGYLSGANSFVQKPVEYAEFQNAVQQLGIYWIGLNQTV